MRLYLAFGWLVMLGGLCACGGGDEDPQPVIGNYASIVYVSYSESVTRAQALKLAVDSFVNLPSPASMEAARAAWVAARVPYLQTEPYRFYNGPIDNETDGPEGRINGWPLDEAYIDYVAGNPRAGIINDPVRYPSLSEQLLADLNEQGGEKNLSTGYHAIEFLLWGQDLYIDGPGRRPYTDYVPGGTAANQGRRGEYLKLVTALLVEDLTHVRDAWAPGASNYRADFVGPSADLAVQRMLIGMGNLSGAELSGERMSVAYDTKDQEDEHSCFSDNTLADLLGNAVGIQNVYLGKFGSIDGPGLDVLVGDADPDLDQRFQNELAASISALQQIPGPFDQAIQGADAGAGRTRVAAAIAALQQQTRTIAEIADALGVTINLQTARSGGR